MTDNVNHPPHYQSESGLEAIEVIDAFFHDNAYLANVFKYIARAGKKGTVVEDLQKARVYLDREIARELTKGIANGTARFIKVERRPRVWDRLEVIPFSVKRVVDRDGDYYDHTVIAGEWTWQATGELVTDNELCSNTYGPFTEVLDV